MPTSEAQTDVNEPGRPDEPQPTGPVATLSAGSDAGGEPRDGSLPADAAPPVVRGSRWVDYDTHELLQMITDLEDERRWARLREGVWIAILIHMVVLSAITWVPRYLFKVPQVIDPFDAIKQRKDLTYLDMPPDALKQIQPKTAPKPLQKPPTIDKQTLDEMKKEAPAPPPPQEAPKPAEQAPVQPQATQPIPPNPQSQSQVEAPRPAAVPARPNFAMNSSNPAEQLRDAMKNAAREHGAGQSGNLGSDRMPMHPGAGSGGVQVLSDTQGRGLQQLAAALALGDGADMGPADSRRSEPADP